MLASTMHSVMTNKAACGDDQWQCPPRSLVVKAAVEMTAIAKARHATIAMHALIPLHGHALRVIRTVHIGRLNFIAGCRGCKQAQAQNCRQQKVAEFRVHCDVSNLMFEGDWLSRPSWLGSDNKTPAANNGSTIGSSGAY